MFTKNFYFGFATLIFIAFFAHLADLGGDTPVRLLFGWAILFSLIGGFGISAFTKAELCLAPMVAFAAIVTPIFLIIMGALGHAVDMSYAWTPALAIFSIALLFIAIDNADLDARLYDRLVSFTVILHGALVLGSADYPWLAAIPGPVAWPSQQLVVFAGYWQVNLMTNILSCLTLWTLWQSARDFEVSPLTVLRGFFAFIVFPLVIGWSRSFSGFVFLLFGLALMAATVWRQEALVQRRHFAYSAGLIGLVLVLAVNGLGLEQAPDVVAKGGASSMPDRIGIWLRSFYAFLEAPFLGHGLGKFAAAYNEAALAHSDTQSYRWVDNTRHAHNMVVHFLVEIGLLGTLLVLAPFAWLGIDLLQRHKQHWVTLAMVAPLLGHMMTGYPQRQSAVPLILLVLIICHAASLYGRGRGLTVSLIAISTKLRLALLAVICVPLIGLSIWTGVSYHFASGRHMVLAQVNYTPQLLVWRLSSPDMVHPFLGPNMRTQAIFGLTSRAVMARDTANLPALLEELSAYEASAIRGASAWRTLFDGYLTIGDYDNAQRIFDIAHALAPKRAENMLAQTEAQMKPELRHLLDRFQVIPHPAE